ncbi:MAG: site-specific DNA-methyltransferase [Glaciecola sp.]
MNSQQANMEELNTLYLGDCLTEMRKIRPNSIDLIYLDPPFFTEKKHSLKNRDGSTTFSFNDIWGDQESYALFLHERLLVMRDLLSDTGSIFVHCDKSANHIVRALLDAVFGAENFQSEIIWHYKRWSNAKKGLLPSHQNIYFFSKTKNFKFRKVFTAYSDATNLDQILQRRTRNKDNKSVYARDANGKVEIGDAKQGVPLNDVWDIPYLNPKAKERVGYPTQKPLLLLDRIIELVTDEDDVVLDPFCGSGTSCVAAKLLKRRYLGIDQSEDAINLAQSRLQAPVKTDSALLTKGRDSFAKQDSVILECLKGLAFNPVNRNQGIDAILIEQFENTPVLVKVQKSDETLAEAATRLLKAASIKGSKRVFLVQTLIDLNDLPPSRDNIDMIVIQTPSVQIQARSLA